MKSKFDSKKFKKQPKIIKSPLHEPSGETKQSGSVDYNKNYSAYKKHNP